MAREGYDAKGSPVVIDPSRKEKKNYNSYFIASDSKFLSHVRRSIPELMAEAGGSGSKFYHPLIWNRFALSLTRERIAGRNADPDTSIDERIRFYESSEHSDMLVSLINERLVTYGRRQQQGESIERVIQGWSKLNTDEAKGIYFDEKAKAYLDGMRDAARIGRRRKRRFIMGGIVAAVLGIVGAVGYYIYDHTWNKATEYADDKFNSSREILKLDVDGYITKLETIANNQEKKVKDMVYNDIIPQLQAGQLSPKTMRLLNELGESLENPEDKDTLVDMIKFLSRARGLSRPEEKKAEKKPSKAPKSSNEEEY